MGKQLLIAVMLLIYCGHASAQLEKGKIYTGISFNGGKTIQFGYESTLSVGLGQHGLLGVHSNYMRGRNFYYIDYKAHGVWSGTGLDYTYFRFFKNSKRLGWFTTAGATYSRFNVYQVRRGGIREINNKYGQTDIYLKPGIFFKSSPNVTFFANFGGIGISNSQDKIDMDLSFLREVRVGVLINIGCMGSCKKRK